jgi:hypothetical protein
VTELKIIAPQHLRTVGTGLSDWFNCVPGPHDSILLFFHAVAFHAFTLRSRGWRNNLLLEAWGAVVSGLLVRRYRLREPGVG